jgi:hypothetical protein
MFAKPRHHLRTDDVRTQSEAARQDAAVAKGLILGPGRFGLSREKEAAGAARGLSLAMGFECRFLFEGLWELDLPTTRIARATAVAVENVDLYGIQKGHEEEILRINNTGSATSPKGHGVSHK